jgi:hypothetical protein
VGHGVPTMAHSLRIAETARPPSPSFVRAQRSETWSKKRFDFCTIWILFSRSAHSAGPKEVCSFVFLLFLFFRFLFSCFSFLCLLFARQHHSKPKNTTANRKTPQQTENTTANRKNDKHHSKPKNTTANLKHNYSTTKINNKHNY